MSSKITMALLVLLLAGVGLWNLLRPGLAESESPARASERLAAIPLRIGPWIGVDNEVNRKAMKIAEAEAHLSRTYRHRTEAYAVMLLYGTPGGLGAHDPKTCYAGTGFEQRGSSAKVGLSNGAGELWNARFECELPVRSALDVYWGWGTRGRWQAPDQPRLTFAGDGRIYKLYVQRSIPALATDSPMNSATEFLDSFLVEVRTALEKAVP